MISSDSSHSNREDVLYAFAVESDLGHDILEQYLRNYPQYAAELIDLSRELSREVCEDETPLSTEDQALVDRAWQRYTDAVSQATTNPLKSLSIEEQRHIARQLDVPRQVITAFREHQVKVESVPIPFLKKLATAINSTVEILREILAVSPEQGLARSYKANDSPTISSPVSFEQLLIEAGVPAEKRALLLIDKS